MKNLLQKIYNLYIIYPLNIGTTPPKNIEIIGSINNDYHIIKIQANKEL